MPALHPSAAAPSQADAAADSGAVEREPNLARFGLRQLFFFFSIATILCAVLARVGGVWPIVVGCAVALAIAHVFGTFLGTRLRDTSEEVQRWKARPDSPDKDFPIALPQPVGTTDFPPPPTLPLAGYERIHRWSNWCVIAGAVGGAVIGAVGIHTIAGNGITWFGIALGSSSCAVIGAWAALLWTTFWTITRYVLRQASEDK
jgi:hypothetical protein